MNDSLIFRFSAARFAMWDLHLYLDTHPHDEKAKELLKEYSIKAEKLKNECERMYGPLTADSGCGKKWTKEPWPWQNDCFCGGEY